MIGEEFMSGARDLREINLSGVGWRGAAEVEQATEGLPHSEQLTVDPAEELAPQRVGGVRIRSEVLNEAEHR